MDNRRNQAASRQGSSTCLVDPTIVHRDVVVLPCVLSYNAVDEGEVTAGKSKTTMQLKYEDGSIKAPALTAPWESRLRAVTYACGGRAYSLVSGVPAKQ